ncbi:DUF3806 domain-containing protein [Microbacterium sp. NPDC089698]|uniref:DUF3806 domain-containing protein n=1 Tax=Microbacterium sp. NPDC089698 TaxID=3364200 RepID=UPI00382E84B5
MALFSKRSSKSYGPKFEEPNQAERDWMAGHLLFAAEMNVDVDDADQVASFYEMLLQSWTESPPESRSDPNISINIIGTAFGEHLVRKGPMRWVIATDLHGTELAVRDQDTDFLVYPANAVAKRWTKGESGAFISVMAQNIISRTNS